MRSSGKAGGKAGGSRSRKPAAPKRNASKISSRGGSSAKRKKSLAKRVKANDPTIVSRQRDEALEQLKATAEVLRVIASSSNDVKPVLKAIVESTCELCEANDAYIGLKDGDCLVFQTQHGSIPVAWKRRAINRQWPAGRAVLDGKSVHLRDVLAREGDEFPGGREIARKDGARTVLVVPLMREGESIGAIILRRTEVQPFSDKQIALLKSFADQAVIAIENARLFNETQEALAQQTATSDVLRVISSSVADTRPVFGKILDSCEKLFATEQLGIFVVQPDGQVHAGAWRGAAFQAVIDTLPKPVEQTATGIVIRNQSVLHFPSTALAKELPDTVREFRDQIGDSSMAWAPMLGEERGVGSICAMRQPPNPFSDKELALLKTFADQAVIAIQNTRLFNETKEALERQTATADILRVIARSPDNVQPVFDAIAESAKRLLGSYTAVVTRVVDGMVDLAAGTAANEAAAHAVQGLLPYPLSSERIHARVARTGELAVNTDLDASSLPESVKEFARTIGWRSMLVVPMLRNGIAIGTIGITRREAGSFDDRTIDLLKTFADQAVIAIENARLFNELQNRTRELSQSLDDLRTAQDRLIQTEKLASLGQLTAGIAHEIKNPLNFVNNFSALSIELTDELSEVLRQEELAEKIQQEVGELTQMLKSNLEKVVQHGKRADSIVKNMLLHSREGSGERRSADINALVGESLNLAYHGARAEKAGFTITLQHDLDPEAGALDLYPQEMTRALLNLISNGFYAATRRKVEAGDGTFEPVLTAATRNLGKTVEIRIRDNGIGIAPEVREKMFNPFFTTKPTGEGTGLGLSMTHDIIVKQHGGRIDVETRLGEFTEFIITLPRGNRNPAAGA